MPIHCLNSDNKTIIYLLRPISCVLYVIALHVPRIQFMLDADSTVMQGQMMLVVSVQIYWQKYQ